MSVPSQSARSFQYWLNRKNVPNVLTQCTGFGQIDPCAFDGGKNEKQMMDFLLAKTV